MIFRVESTGQLGPLALGMSIDDAETALRSLDGFQGAGESLIMARGVANYSSGMSIHVQQESGLLSAIEVYRPHRVDSLVYEDIALFESPAEIVIDQLREAAEIKVEEEGCSVIVPSVLLALWRPFVAVDEVDEQGFYFQSVLLARPGYYG